MEAEARRTLLRRLLPLSPNLHRWRRTSAAASLGATIGRRQRLPRLGQPVHLLDRRCGHEKDELVAADRFVRLDTVFCFAGTLDRSLPHPRAPLTVVVEQVRLCLRVTLIA